MSTSQKFSAGIEFISNRYRDKLHGQQFDRDTLKRVVGIYMNIGFKHITNDGTLAVLSISKYGVNHTVKIGKLDDSSFFLLETV